MSDSPQTLIRRMAVKSEAVRKGLFSKESRIVLDGSLDDGERLFCIRANDIAEEMDPKKLPNEDGLRLFAVQCDRFDLFFRIPLGQEKDGFHWYLELGGRAKIRKTESFLVQYYSEAKNSPFASHSFIKALGTRPSNLLLDAILHKSMEVLTLDDLNVDVAKWAKERNLTENAFTEAFAAKDGTPFFKNGDKGSAVEFTVNSVIFASPERDYAIKAQRAEEERKRKEKEEADKKRQADEQRERDNDAKRKEEDAKREEQRKQKEHELKMAELEAQTKKLQGGDTASAFAAFETISNVLEDVVAKAGTGSFVDLMKDARRAESGLRLLALARDKKRMGGVTLAKKKPSFQARTLTFTTKKTPALHNGETLSSVITSERRDGYLTVLNVSECNEIIPMLPNVDFPDVRVARGEETLIGDDASDYIPEIKEGASSGTDNLVAIVSDAPLLAAPLSPLGEALSAAAAAELMSRLEALDAAAWAADVISFIILP